MLDLARNEDIVEESATNHELLMELAASQLLLVGGGSGDVLWG